MSRGGHEWGLARALAGLTLALIAASSCTSGGAAGGDTVTVRSAVGTDVVVTVRDGVGAALAGRTVYAVKNNGSIAGAATTNAGGEATLNLAASSYRFLVEEDGSDFYSGAVGHCVTPGCTTAMITVPRVDVTVVDTSGSPQVNQMVLWENTTGGTGGFVSTGANGHVVMAVPTGSYRFVATQNDFDFTSGAAGHCTVPSCTSATITTTIPVTVTVRDTTNAPKPNLLVSWATTLGETGGWVNTNASGVAVLSVPQASLRFAVDVASESYCSGAPGHCVVPGCTTASITVPAPVVVTVVDTGGTPLSGKTVMWQDASLATGGNTNTNASGQAILTPPLVPVRFKTTVDGTAFYSSDTFNCTQPGCTSATILVSQPSVVTVVDGSGNPISGRAVTPVSTEGITSGNKTTNTSGQATFRLPFAHWQFKAKCSGNNETFFSGNAGHCYIPGGCLTAKIKMPCGQCAGKPNGFACDDQTACSGSSTCQSQFCTGSSPMSCSASDQCHDAGACGAETGTCSNPAKANGSACNDNDACTGTSSCQAGVCTGGSPTTCAAQDQCHVAGTCNPATGVCSNPAKMDGTSCSDGNSCTGPDTCQAGSCTAGANTCGSIVASEIINASFWPTLSATLQADDLSVTPGDPIGFTAAVNNTGVTVYINGEFRADNPGSGPFVVKGFSETLEYHDVATGEWTPFARVVYDTAGNVVPETILGQLVLSYVIPVAGGETGTVFPSNPPNSNYATETSIPAGGYARWGFNAANLLLPPDVVDVVFDPTKSDFIISVVRFDMPSGPPQSGVYVLNGATSGVTGDVDNVGAQLRIWTGFEPEHVSSLASAESGPLPTGGLRIFTGTIAAPVVLPFPASPGETEAQYSERLFWDHLGYWPTLAVTGQATPIAPPTVGDQFNIGIELPLLGYLIKTGPASINAGLAGAYSLAFTNTGNAPASAFAITDAIDGSPVTVTETVVPATIGPDPATGTATFRAAAPLERPVGPMTDVAGVTWQDRNGNAYGPVTASYTGNITAGHPEGYLSVKVDTGIPDVINFSKPIVATALDPYGNPAAGVAVHFAVTGVNPQTADITTGGDGKATFSYAGTVMGDDSVVVSATITTTLITLDPIPVQWAQSVGTPCTGRTTPLDVMLVVDVSPSMQLEPISGGFTGNTGKLEAAQAAADRFIDDLTYPRDQVGVATFMGGIITSAQLATAATNAKAQLDGGIAAGIFCATNFCPGFSDVANALNFALDELETPRHRPEAQTVIVYVGDGGADVDPATAIARLRASGARAVSIGLGSNFDGQMVVARSIADSPNDYFYSPSGPAIDFAFNNLNQDLCRNRAPFVSAGGNQGFYNARLPDVLTLQGEVHDDGPDGDTRLTTEWSQVSGPAPVGFLDASAPVTKALFSEPGTYVLQLAASDGFLTVADRATITVDPAPNLVGASVVVALGAPSPLLTGTTETVTATLRDAAMAPIGSYPINLTIAGANPATATAITNAAGVASFSHAGTRAGTDQLRATAFGAGFQIDSAIVPLAWNDPPTGGPTLTQGWIASPVTQSTVSERVQIVLSDQIRLTSGTLSYWPSAQPTDVRTLATGLVAEPSDTLATLDTTLLANGSYIISLDGVDDTNNQRQSLVLVTVAGDYKPGRVVVEVVDLTVPIAGLPITVGRRYDSLEKDSVGDFGHGWSLLVGHPKLEVDQAKNVSLTMPNGRRVTFGFAPTLPVVAGGPVAIILGFLAIPSYVPEPGVFGTLAANGCSLLTFNPYAEATTLNCFDTLEPSELEYAPTEYTYTDPYGTVYVMGATGELRSIRDRQGNSLTFQPNGIISSSGRSVTFERDPLGRITKVASPPFFGQFQEAAETHYDYDAAGDLTTVTLPPIPNVGVRTTQHTYAQHRLLTTRDPRGNPARTSTYYPDGRLEKDTDALAHETRYAYDLATRTTTTTFHDEGVLTQVFDTQGLIVSETDQRGNVTTHEYDPNRNEKKRTLMATSAHPEVTTAIYEGPNQVSVTDALGTTHTTYNASNLPFEFRDRLNHLTTIDYDDRGVPARFADELGTRFRFTNSEQGVPLTVDDAENKRAYLTYDAAGNVTSRTDWLGRVTRATFDQAGHKLTETTARGGLATFTYALSGNVTSSVDTYDPTDMTTPRRTRTFSYDLNGNLVAEEDNAGHRKEYTYDALNHLTQVRDFPDGATPAIVTYERDFRGNPTSMTDENGHRTEYEYDKAGNLTKTTFKTLLEPETSITRTYDELNRVASVKNERNYTTTYQYQPGCGCSDRVTVVAAPLNHTTTTGYDANGRRVSVMDANNHTTTFEYDVRNHLTKTHYHDQTEVVDTYDPRGRRDTTRDQMLKLTRFGYDDQGQLTSVIDPLENLTTYGYDADGNLTSVTDANDHTTTYEYDLLKHKTKRTLPLGQFETFVYDVAGNQVFHTDFRGKTTAMTYDRRDRMLTKVPDASLGEPSHSYVYTPTNRRLSSTDGTGTTSYTYDEHDRMLTKAAAAGKLTYTYDATGNVATIRSSNQDGSPRPNSTSVDYVWDAANQLFSVTDNRVGGGPTTAAYTATGRPSSLSQPNGVGLTYSYDALTDRVTSMAWRKGTAAPFGTWSYGYNNRGQRTSSTDITGRAATYGYDDASRLTSETITSDPRGASFNGALSYGIDGAGNRLTRTSTLAALAAQSFSYDANDQLATETYDANGNTLTSGGHSFAYDFENRLVSKDGGAVTINYDCDGNRVAKTVGGVTTRYLVDELNPTGYLQVLEEIVGGAVQTRYTYGTSIVSQTRSVSSTPVTTYYGRDAHGNTTFLTDDGGAVVSSYDYDAWGNVVASTGSTPNTRLFAGEEFDPDLGLLNLRARQYSLDTGRFLTLDPLDIDTADDASLLGTLVNAIAVHVPPHSRAALDLGGLSGVPLSDRLLTPLSLKRYLYANSDPVTFIDPLGQNVLAESTPLIQALLSPAVRAALVTLAVRAAVAIAAVVLAVTVGEIIDEIHKEWSGKLGGHKDFARCWLTVAKPMLTAALANLIQLADRDPEAFKVGFRALYFAVQAALKECIVKGGGGSN